MADQPERPQLRLLDGGRSATDPPVALDHLELPTERSAPRTARRWAALVAARHGITGFENQTVELLTGELVGLAVLNSAPGTAVRLEVLTTAGVVEVSAHHAPGDAHDPPSPLEAEEWGTALLRALSTDCGIEESDGGCRTSWFQLAVPG
ncbi:ATP-binding protein [Georgenia faecalis]|uniref:ATP-binding protein n=1 Tax=Georgenia faecalis TaxID=2483799 RepID=A0ABV9D959_9MICO|nr:hypothetical protein [Georgenia faecalis]